MDLLTIVVFSIVLMLVLLCVLGQILQLYEREGFLKEKSLFKKRRFVGCSKLEYQLDWEYVYLFSISKVVKSIYAMKWTSDDKVLKIEKYNISNIKALSKKDILNRIIKYRKEQMTIYVLEHKDVLQIAEEIEEKEIREKSYCITKALWLLHGEKDTYRTIFKKTNEDLYSQGKITEYTYLELKQLIYK